MFEKHIVIFNMLTHWADLKKFFKSFVDQDFNREFEHALCFDRFFDSVWRSTKSFLKVVLIKFSIVNLKSRYI